MNDNAIRDIERAYRKNFMVWVALFLVISAAWLWFAFYPVPLGRAVMTLDTPRLTSAAALCPGETLAYSFVVAVAEPGIFEFDQSVWGLQPRRGVVFERPLRLAVAGAERWQVHWWWEVPDQYENPRTGEMTQWLPGDYEVVLGITSVSRDTVPSLARVPFTIREGCE